MSWYDFTLWKVLDFTKTECQMFADQSPGRLWLAFGQMITRQLRTRFGAHRTQVIGDFGMFEVVSVIEWGQAEAIDEVNHCAMLNQIADHIKMAHVRGGEQRH